MASKIVGFLFSVILFSCSTERNNSPIILEASQNSGPGATILKLRQDGSCEWIGGIFDSMHEGKYQLQDSIITLEGIDLGDESKTNRLLFTKHNPNNADWHEPILLRVNRSQQIVDRHLILNVTIDKR
jgi:hypothetical protein